MPAVDCYITSFSKLNDRICYYKNQNVIYSIGIVVIDYF